MAKRKLEDISGFVHSISPSKNKSFRFNIQDGESSTRRAICFDLHKLPEIRKLQESCEPVSIKKAVIQTPKTDSHAEIIINKMSEIKQPRPNEVNFPRNEPTVNIVKLVDIKNLEGVNIGDLVSVKARFNVERAKEKTVIAHGKPQKILENCYLMDSTGAIKLSLWNEYIKHFKTKISNGTAVDLKIYNLQIKNFDSVGIFLSTCSSTFVHETEILEDVTPPPEADDDWDTLVVSVKSVTRIVYYYKCLCSRLVKASASINDIITCSICGSTTKADRLDTTVIATVMLEEIFGEFSIDHENMLLLWPELNDVPFSVKEEEIIEHLLNCQPTLLLVDKSKMTLSVIV